VADAGAGGHGGLQDGCGAEFGEEVVEVDGLAARVRRAVEGADVDAFVGLADAAAPRRFEGDLDAVVVGVPK
jgi:hypothetical protein